MHRRASCMFGVAKDPLLPGPIKHQGLVIASEAIARSFGVFGSLLDEFDDAFIALPCPAEEDDVKRMVDLIVALRASSGVECPICYEALGDNSLKTGCCNQPMHFSCLYRALARTPTCPLCLQAGAERAAPEPRGPSPLPVDADHFLRFYTAPRTPMLTRSQRPIRTTRARHTLA